MIDRATVDKILDAARIVDVVGDFVTLRKSGVNYKGLCPFHDDRNPSFMVSPAKNICHCFVCGKGGTPAGFLMEHEQMTYPEALRWLARKYNIEIVEKELTDEERAAQSERESMFIVNEWAKDWFHDSLLNSDEGKAIGLQYFRSRGIRDDIIHKFNLGYALAKRDSLCSTAIEKGYKKEFLIKTGLCIENERGLYDRYSGRVIFPWFNVSGKIVAFGGRLLDSRTKGVAQKYVNSPDSDIYHKERELYGIYQAKKAIVKEDRVFMVEGYTDVIAMHQAGIENVVANSGTALSVFQIHMLRRFTQNITLLYDGDEAGIHAAMRGTDMLLAEGMNIKVLLLPDGDDPDSFARKHSTEELKKYIDENQTDFITFKTRLTVQNIDDPVKRSEGIGGIVQSISVIPDQILRSTYISDLSRRTGIKEQTLIAELNKKVRKNWEDREKERERDAQRQQGNGIPQPTASSTSAVSPDEPPVFIPDEGFAEPVKPVSNVAPAVTSHTQASSQVELLLLREIVRHGEEIIFDDVETDDGGHTSISVAQYIDLDLSQDGLQLSQPLYQQMLSEAVAHCGEPGFKATDYFCAHRDPQVSQLAIRLAMDRHQLAGRFIPTPRDDSLRLRVQHLVMDYRLHIADQQLKHIQQQLRQAGDNLQLTMQLLKEHKETKELRDLLAKRLGSDLVV